MRLIEAISPDIEQALSQTDLKPRRSLWGICANLGEVPTAEDIDEIRQEMGLNFY